MVSTAHALSVQRRRRLTLFGTTHWGALEGAPSVPGIALEWAPHGPDGALDEALAVNFGALSRALFDMPGPARCARFWQAQDVLQQFVWRGIPPME